MPVLTTIRQSPAYLYLKTYCLCAIVTLFQAAPVTSRIPRVGERRQRNKNRSGTPRLGPSVASTNHHETSLQLNNGEDSPGMSDPSPTESRSKKIVKRWIQRAWDLAQIKKQLRVDEKDIRTYPEINWDATVRRSSSINPEERRFIELRKHRISSQGVNSLHSFLGLPEGEKVDPQDVPLIALGGSGGGYRAMYGFAAFMSASQKLRLWDCLTWTAGVSGSCWTLAAYYTIANHDFNRLIKHYLSIAREVAHPMSLHAFETVVRSSKGVYFLIGPLVRKVQCGIIGLGIMDLYGTLTTTYQFLSREPRARLSRATFQFSKVWTRSGIDRGIEPMPIFTAVRRAPKDMSGVKPHTDSSLSKGQPPTRALKQHQSKASGRMIAGLQRQKSRAINMKPSGPVGRSRVEPPDSSLSKGFFQWFEISPLEVGSPDVQGYIPTWSWGRSFDSGRSVGRPPEQSLALLLGQCTSAPAGPLTGYISALLASMPNGTVMSRLLLLLNDFVRMKNWERLWGNPIRAGHDPNPFYGHNNRPPPRAGNDMNARSHALSSPGRNPVLRLLPDTDSAPVVHNDLRIEHPVKTVVPGNTFYSNSNLARLHTTQSSSHPTDSNSNITPRPHAPPKQKWEYEGRIRLMDSGMSNNLPSHILSRPSRGADIILAFDASSDVQNQSAIQRIQNFADDCHLDLEEETDLFDAPEAIFGGGKDGKGGNVIVSGNVIGNADAGREVEQRFLSHYARVFRGTRDDGREVWLVYCPLLPNGIHASFNPSTASFSNSYNLVWTPAQIQTLFSTSEANLSNYTIKTIKQVVRKVYLAKISRRLERGTDLDKE